MVPLKVQRWKQDFRLYIHTFHLSWNNTFVWEQKLVIKCDSWGLFNVCTSVRATKLIRFLRITWITLVIPNCLWLPAYKWELSTTLLGSRQHKGNFWGLVGNTGHGSYYCELLRCYGNGGHVRHLPKDLFSKQVRSGWVTECSTTTFPSLVRALLLPLEA